MTTIHERHFLKCPYIRARQYLHDALQGISQRGESQRLRLDAPLSLAPAKLEKTVLVRYEHATDPMHFDEPWRVRWTPEGGGPYPDFSGELTVRSDESYRSAILELRGEYVPPFGMAGRAFDLAAGSKIASATARALLARLGEQMEARYQSEEAGKGCSSTS